MTETTEEKQVNFCDGCGVPIDFSTCACDDCITNLEIDLPFVALEYREDKIRIKEMQAQVSFLTEERDGLKSHSDHLQKYITELQGRLDNVIDKSIKRREEMDALKSQLSNREKEIEELKEQVNNPWRSHKDAPRNGMEITALFGGEEENQIPTIIRYDAEDDEWIDRDYSSFWGDAEFIWTTAPYSEHNNDCRLSLNKEGEE